MSEPINQPGKETEHPSVSPARTAPEGAERPAEPESRSVESGTALPAAVAPPSGSRAGAGWRSALTWAISVTLVGLVAALAYFWLHRPSGAVDPHRAMRALAILPFKPLVAEPHDEFLGLGMADALITRLSYLRPLIVRPTSAVRKYAGLEQAPVAAGRELGVNALLDGHLHHTDERLRVTVRLVRVQDSATLWAQTFDTPFRNIFAVQDTIAEQVARALGLKLTEADKRRLTKRYTENIAAYQFYVKGLYYSIRRSDEELKQGIEYFAKAIEKDPGYALAYAGLAGCYGSRGFSSMLPPREAFTQAEAATRKALALDDKLVEAHTTLAYKKLNYDWDWAGAEKEYRRAIELNSGYVPCHIGYARYLMVMGRTDEGLAELRRARELDPVSLPLQTFIGILYYHARQYDRTLEQSRKVLALDPNFASANLFLGLVYEQRGEYPEAIAALQKAVVLSRGRREILAALGHAYAVAGQRDEALRIIGELEGLTKQGYVSPYGIALIYLGLGETDQAFAWLEKAYTERTSRLILLKVDPRFDPLRADPRFADLLRRIGFPP